MATTTYKSFLMHGSTSNNTTTYSKLVDIKDYPKIGGDRELVETTTLSDDIRTHIMGLQSGDSMPFTCNYDKDKFTAIKAMADTEQDLAVWFGGTVSGGVVTPDGSDGKFSFKGFVDVTVEGKGVNDVREMIVTVAASSAITVA